MAISDIYGTISELRLSYRGSSPDILQISGDIYAVACAGDDRDGWLFTIEITSSGQSEGTISSIISSLEFAPNTTCYSAKIRRVSGDIYAIAYGGKIVTVEISSNGTIVGIVDEPKTFLSTTALDFLKIATGMFAIASSHGFSGIRVTTIGVSDAGAIDDAITDSLAVTGLTTNYASICHIGEDIYALLSQKTGFSDGIISTVTIDSAGNISDAVIDTLEFYDTPIKMLKIATGIFAVIAQKYIKTVAIDSLGEISSFINSLNVTGSPYLQDIILISGDIYAVAWSDSGLQIGTIDIDSSGNIGGVLLDQNEIDSVNGYGATLILVSSATTGLLAIVSSWYGAQSVDLHTVGIGEGYPLFIPKIMIF